MATPKPTKAPKVGSYRGGSKTSVGGRGGFLGKTTSGGNLGRAAMSNQAAISAAKGYGRSGGANAAAFGVGGGPGLPVGGGSAGGSTAYGGAPGMGNASGVGMDYSASGLIESILNPGGAPYVGGGYQPSPGGSPGGGGGGGGWGEDYPGVTFQAPDVSVGLTPDMPQMPPDVGPGSQPYGSTEDLIRMISSPSAPAVPAPSAPAPKVATAPTAQQQLIAQISVPKTTTTTAPSAPKVSTSTAPAPKPAATPSPSPVWPGTPTTTVNPATGFSTPAERGGGGGTWSPAPTAATKLPTPTKKIAW